MDFVQQEYVMTVFDVLKLIGGVGLFLYGMKYLGASLERMAGAGLESTLGRLTNTRFKGLTLGVLVTGLIQSSSATTIMVVGFVNAGIMKLPQAIPVLLGADIGTTVTGQILRLGDISSSGGSIIFDLIKPSSFAPLLIGIAAFIMLLSKKKKSNDIASIMMGFGILFFGMNTMETAMAPLSESQAFREFFVQVSNPFLGLLMGILLAAVLQSSSAAVGIVQALASTGSVTFAVAAPMIIGIKIGKIFPVVLASIGTKKEAQQVTVTQISIGLIGALVAMPVLYLVLSPLGVVNWDAVMTRGNVADVNTIYNIIISVLLIPACPLLAKLTKTISKDGEPSKIDEELAMLDDMLIKTPGVALDQCVRVINNMGATVIENYFNAIDMHDNFDPAKVPVIEDNEQFLDKSETYLNDYLVKITSKTLREDEIKLATEVMHSVMDFERMGDHCVKLYEVAAYNQNAKIKFSGVARRELDIILTAVGEILNVTTECFAKDDDMLALNVEPLAELIEFMGEEIKERHVKRLQAGTCTVQGGISLVECLTSLERISAYCSNVALHVIEKHADGDSFDIHEYANEMHTQSVTYTNLYDTYSAKYLDALKGIDAVEEQ